MEQGEEQGLSGVHKEGAARRSANRLLDREPPVDYAEEWARQLTKAKTESVSEELASVIIFRLYDEWLALNTELLVEIIKLRKIHLIPHRCIPAVRGLVNIGGRLCVCMSLRAILEIEPNENEEILGLYERIIVIEAAGEKWAFPVDDVFGIYHYKLSEVHNVPVTVSNSKVNYLKGLFLWQDRNVGLLSEELLLAGFRRSLL